MACIRCPKGGFHYDEPIQWVCLNESCKQDMLACNICYYENHSKHQVEPLRSVIEQLPKQIKVKLENLNNLVGIDQKFMDLKISIEANQQKNSENIYNNIYKTKGIKKRIQQFYLNFLDKKKEKIDQTEVMGLVQTLNTTDDAKTFEKTAKALLQCSNYQYQGERGSIKFNPKSLCDKAKEQITEFSKAVKDSATQINEVLKQIDSQVSEKNLISSSCNSLQFEKLHETDIEYTNNFTIGKRIRVDGYKICLTKLELKPSMVKTFGFKVINSSTWISLGVFYKKKAETANYAFNYSNLGYGGYLISSNGGSWSSHDSSYNNTIKTFSFTSGDTIMLTYDGPKKLLQFKSKNTNKEYQLKLEYIEKDILCPAIVYYYQNTQIELVNKVAL